MRVLVENSSWNNIGDGFYQFSLFNLLKKEFPQHDYAFLDGPSSRSFRYSDRFAKNVFKAEDVQDSDLYVFSGPILNSRFMLDYAPLIKKLNNRGAKYAIISAHGDPKSANSIRTFLQSFPPILLASRDRATFNLYCSSNFPTYDGICTASLVSLTCEVGETVKSRPYIASSFYNGYEPKFEVFTSEAGITGISGIESWKPTPQWRLWRHLEWMTKTYPKSIKGYEIIRPVHDIGYKFSHLNYARANSFLSYNPLIYLSLYKGASLTVTNRLHAAIPTISFGNPAVYVGATARNGALDRLGLKDYQGKTITLSSEIIQNEYEALVRAMRERGF